MKPARPLSRQWLLRLLLLGSVYCLLVSGVRLYLGSQAQQQQLQQLPQLVRQQFMPQLVQSLRHGQREQTQQLLHGLQQLDGVVQLSVLDEREQVQWRSGSAQHSSHRIELPLSAGSQRVPGTLRLDLSLRSMESRLWHSLLQSLLELSLLLLLIALLSRQWLQHSVVRPLQALGRHWPALAPQPVAAAGDEIALFEQQLAAQQQHCQHTVQQAEQEMQALQQQGQQLSGLLATRTAELEQLSRFHQMICEMSSRLIQLNQDDIEAEVRLALARIGQLLDVDRCYLFRVTPSLRIHQTQEWCRSGIDSTAHVYEDYPLKDSPWFVPQLLRQHLVALSQLDDMPPEGHSERLRFQAHGIQSIAVLTLSYRGQVLGFFGCDCVLEKRDWLDKELSLMRLFSEMLCHVLRHHRYQRAHDTRRLLRPERTPRHELEASVDTLTGLANRKTFERQLQKAFVHAAQTAQPLSLLLLDIDLFKAYNECFGPLEGDKCLVRLAALLLQHFPTRAAHLARLDGDTFAALLPGTGAAQALPQAEKLRLAVWQLGIPHISSAVSTCITVSAAVSSLDTTRHDDGESLLGEAERYLAQGKTQGRNRVIHHGNAGQADNWFI